MTDLPITPGAENDAVTDAETDARPGRERPADRESRWVLLAFAAAALPVVVALVRLRGQHWFPSGDMAQAELHVRGIWEHPPLVGAAGRITGDTGIQGSHPGPSLWFAMYPVYALFGRTSFGLMAGAASVHLIAIAGALVMARRRGGTPLVALVGLLIVVLVRSSGPMFFTEPWNPWLALFPFLVFVLAVWDVADGRVRSLPLAVVTGSHAVQCHTGYLVIVLALLGAATVWALVEGWRRGGAERSRVVRWTALGTASGVAMWLLPLIDQLTRDPGNMTLLLQNFSAPDEPYLAKGLVARATLSQLSLLGPWLTGPAVVERNLVAVVLTALLWTAAILLAARRRDREVLTLHAVLGLAVLVGLFSMERVFGSYFEYTVRWWWVVTGLIVAASLWTVARARPERVARFARPLAAGLVATTLAVSAVAAVQFGDRVHLSGGINSELIAGVVDQVETGLEPGDEYLVRFLDPVALGAVPFGLGLELARRGFSIGFDEQFTAAALPQRILPEADADGVLYVVIGAKIAEVRALGTVQEIGTFDVRTPDEVTRSDELFAFLEQRFVEIGQPELRERLSTQYGYAALLFSLPPLPDDILAAVSELVELRQPVAVFLASPGTEVPGITN